jgi:hypothetical protein
MFRSLTIASISSIILCGSLFFTPVHTIHGATSLENTKTQLNQLLGTLKDLLTSLSQKTQTAAVSELKQNTFPLLSSTNVNANMFADYESSWKENSVAGQLEHTSGVWTMLVTSHGEQKISIDSTYGVDGRSAKIDVVGYGADGLFKILFAYNENRYTTLDAPKGHNRMTLNVTIPYAGSNENHMFHIGTYAKDPNTASMSSTLGNHWYHYYELRGSKGNYWTKMYMDEHPQHEVSNDEPPSINPTIGEGFNYFDGLTRLYLQMRYSPFETTWPGPYTMHVDEIEFYTETRVENDYSINSPAITYQGNGEFDIDWTSFSQYDIHNNTFEIRYSFTPINTETDYNNANLVPGSPSAGWGEGNLGRTRNYYRATFTIPNIDESKKIYFAIKDLYASHPKDLKRIDYQIINGGNNQETQTTCTAFTYSSWNSCQSTNTQTRTILTSSPTGCTGGTPITTQSCTYVPPAPTDTTAPTITVVSPQTTTLPSGTTQTVISLTTNEGATCRYGTSSGTAYTAMLPFTVTGSTLHSVTITGLTNGSTYTRYILCRDTAGNTSALRTLTFSVATPTQTTCTAFTYSSWNSCQSTNTQTRTILTSSPTGCTGGTPITTQSCTYVPPAPTSTPTVDTPPKKPRSSGGGGGSSKPKPRTTDTTTTTKDTVSIDTTVSVPQTTTATRITRNLTIGDRGDDVRQVQVFLNTHGFPIAETGDGSRGHETGYFGEATKNAIIRFQNQYRSDILTPAGMTQGTGYLGEATRAKIASLSTTTTTPSRSSAERTALIASLRAQLEILVAELERMMGVR